MAQYADAVVVVVAAMAMADTVALEVWVDSVPPLAAATEMILRGLVIMRPSSVGLGMSLLPFLSTISAP